MNNNIYTFLCILFFISCSKHKYKSNVIKIKKFEKTHNLKGEQILINDYSAFSINVIDSLLLTHCTGTDTHYNLYSKNTFKFLGSLGTKGNTPEAWLFPTYNNQFEKDSLGLKIWLSSHVKSKIIQVNLTKTIKSKSKTPFITKSFNINSKVFPFTKLLYVNDSVFYGDSGYFDSQRCRLKRYNLETEITNHSSLFPKIINKKLFPSEMLKSLYYSLIQKKTDETVFVSAMEYFNRVDVFDENLNTKLTILGNGLNSDNQIDASTLKIDEGSPFDEFTIYYRDIDLTKTYIYCLYLNQVKNKFGKEIKPVEIRVFDWNGNPKYLLKIPEYLMNISVDEKEGWIYGVAPYSEKILRYNIKNIIK